MTNSLPSVNEQIAEMRKRHEQMTIELNHNRRYSQRNRVVRILLVLLIFTNLAIMSEMAVLIVLLLTWPNS